MTGLEELLSNMKNVYHLEGATEDSISSAQFELGLSFADDYRDYLRQYSLLSYESHELTGLCKSDRLNVVSATKREKEDNSYISSDMYLIEQIGVENLTIWQDSKGNIYSVEYQKPPVLICNSLIDYIKGQC